MISHSKPTIKKSDAVALSRVLQSRQITSGSLAKQFCDKLKKFFKAKQVILTPSGTAAIVEALRLLKVKSPDEVIIPAYVCSNVARAVMAAGARSRVVDINRHDYNIAYQDVVKKINKNTKAIIIPHIFGNPAADIKKFLKLGITIIEDVAQGLGAESGGRAVGSFGDLTICSFYATKMITTGEGGALIIRNPKLSQQFRPGDYFYKMPDMQAALGVRQLRNLNTFIQARRQLFAQYLKSLKNNSACWLSHPKDSIYYRCIIEVQKAELQSGINKMNKQGIMAARFTDLVFNYLNLSAKNYPNTREAIDKVVSLPLYPTLTKQEVNSIITASKKAFLIDKKGKK